MKIGVLKRASGLFVYSLLATAFTPAYASSGPDAQGLILSAIGLLVGIWAFFHGFTDLRIKRRMEDIPVSTLRAMAPGQVEVSGQAVDWKPQTGPLTNLPCVYFEYQIEQKVGSGKNSHWETILEGKTDQDPFFIDDETACAMVRPAKAQIILDDVYHMETGFFHDVPPHIDAFMSRQGISCKSFFGFEKTLRFTERHFKPGEKVFVLGTCQEDLPVHEAPPHNNFMDNISLASMEGNFFILSNESRKQLESSFGWKAFAGIFGGIALIGTGLYFLIKLLNGV